MRRKEIDWIRNIGVLMLFIFHTSVIFAYFGDWYIRSPEKNILCGIFVLITYPWYMPILFFLAGVSMKFSLESRGENLYFKERVERLLIPFLFALVVIVPPQTYFARLWRGEKVYGYLEHLKYFFTNFGDFTGYDGKFTPAHLWFILFLFIISILGFKATKYLRTKKGKEVLVKVKERLLSKNSVWWLLLVIFIGEIVPPIAGQNIIVDLTIFILGYVVYCDEDYLMVIDKCKRKLLIVTVILSPFGVLCFMFIDGLNLGLLGIIINVMLKDTIMITSIISIIGYGRKYLNRGDKILKYLNRACFPVYIIHQTIVVMMSYYILPLGLPIYISILLIIICSVIGTFTIYEIAKRIKPLNVLLGIK